MPPRFVRFLRPALRPRALALLSLLALAACTTPGALAPSSKPASPDLIQPESASGWTAKQAQASAHFAVAAAHPLASDAGREILLAGGSALDAAIAVQMVLTLVEPQSSGIGGGAFLLHWDGAKVQAFDGRETAPAAADENLFLKPDGKPMPYLQAVVGGRSVGTPGLLRMLEQAHAQHGKLPWARLFEPAIRLCEQGYALSGRSHKQLLNNTALRQDPQAGAYFFDAQGQALPEGSRLRNPALAAVLRQVAAGGADAFLKGTVAQDIVRRVRGHASNPGLLSEADLAGYQPRQREVLCTPWRGQQVCGFPPPSSGHLTVMQMLGMMPAQTPAQAFSEGVPSAAWLHRYAEASKLAFADRAQFIADPDFVAAPGGDWRSLLAPEYLQARAALIGPRSMASAAAGQPAAALRVGWAPMPDQPEHGTSHISIIDAAGRAVAMTTSIEAGFGARIMSDGGTGLPGGFMLNNQLTDFALAPRDEQGRPVANRLQPGKRPRSSMAPTLVFDASGRRLSMSLGSPGGPAIIHFVAKTLLATADWQLDVQQALDLPNFGNFGGPVFLEQGRFPAATREDLQARGHRLVETELTSGIQAIQRSPTGWLGGADPRRDGAVRGD